MCEEIVIESYCDFCDYEREGTKCCCCDKLFCCECKKYHEHNDCIHNENDIKEVLDRFLDLLNYKAVYVNFNPEDKDYNDKVEKLKFAYDIVRKL